MKYINNILEFNTKDKKILLSQEINNTFTVAFEFELESDDNTLQYSKSLDQELLEIIDDLTEELKENKIKYNQKFIDLLIKNINLSNINNSIDFLLKQPKYNYQYEVVNILIELLKDYSDNLNPKKENSNTELLKYAENKVKENLPIFYNKYHNELKFVFDHTLKNGIEFSPKKYLFGLNDAIEMINIFFDDFNNQNYWKMNNNTSIHINLGFSKEVNWNIVKGLIMLGEIKKDDVPFVFKGIENRINTNFTKNLLKYLKNNTLYKLKNINNIKKIETIILNDLGDITKEFGSKTFSVNIDRIKNNQYVEFRHIGGLVNKELVIDKLMYFAYIAYMMVTNYKENDYHKKLYKFIFID